MFRVDQESRNNKTGMVKQPVKAQCLGTVLVRVIPLLQRSTSRFLDITSGDD
jgi:hypothetical protein